MRDLVDELLAAKVKAKLFGGDHPVRLGRLVIEARLGRGASGTVFAAYDPRLERRVAVKVVHGGDGVLREARALAKLAHPSVVAVHDAGEADGAVHVVMELAPGVPLRAWIGASPPSRDVVRAMHQVAAGLAAVHRAGLVHRDVKPDNVLIGDGRARLVDFGLAHDAAGGAGTPAYMAPEVLAGAGASAASDQFSFGVTLFEVLAGRRPFAGATRDELRAAIARGPVELPRGVPAWLRAVVARTLQPEPRARFGSMDAVVAALDRDRARTRRLIGAAAGAIAIAAIAGGAAVARGESVSPCGGGSVRAEAAWSPARAEQMRVGLAPWGDRVAAALDDAAARWSASYARVCEATRVRGEQSDRLLEVRMQCLDRALDRTAAFVRAAEDAAMPVSARALAATSVQALPDPAACEAVVDGDVPVDPRLAAARADLDGAWASYQLGRYRDARARLDAPTFAAAGVLRAGEQPGAGVDELAAERLLLAGAIDGRLGGAGIARRDLQGALGLARAPAIELAVWVALLRVELFAGEPAHVVDWEPFARAAAARAGDRGAELDAIIGEALRDEHRYAEARTTLRRAVAAGTLRPDQRALVAMNLGTIALSVGDVDDAGRQLEQAHDLARGMLGDDHPEIAIYLDKLGALARERGDVRGALALHDRSLAIRRAAFGDDDRTVATSLYYRGLTLVEAGRLGDARADLEQARASRARAFGDRSARLGEIDAALGDVAAAGGDAAGALAAYDRAAGEDRRLELAARRYLAGRADALGDAPGDADELSVDAAVRTAALVDRLVRAGDPLRARALALRLRDRAQTATSPTLLCAVGDALARAGEDAHDAFARALASLADQPSRTRAHALAGLGRDTAAVRVAMPELYWPTRP